jgi:hypothetical protein
MKHYEIMDFIEFIIKNLITTLTYLNYHHQSNSPTYFHKTY